MQSKSILTGMVVAVLTLFVAGGVVEAKKGKGGSNGSTDTRFEADLEPFNIPGPNAEGNSERRTKTKNNAIKDDRFKATVEIPIPNGLGIDENNARSQDIRLILTDELGGFIAECQLVFDDIEQDLTTGQLEAEYKLDLRAKKRGKGSCEGIVNNSGLPDVVRGDVAIATLVTNPSDRTQDIELLQGTYDQH